MEWKVPSVRKRVRINSDGTYTKYTVVKNRFVRFVNGVDQDGAMRKLTIFLKVTLRNENGETLMSLFLSDQASVVEGKNI